MTRTSSAVILGIFSSLAVICPAQTQAPTASTDTKQSTSQLTLSLLSHFKKVYTAAANAKDKTSAEKAVANIALELKQIDTLSPVLTQSTQPTDAEMVIVAEAIAKMEFEMRKQMEILARNLKNKDVRALIDPSMKQFTAKAGEARTTMDKLYPATKMLPLVKAAKARLQVQKNK